MENSHKEPLKNLPQRLVSYNLNQNRVKNKNRFHARSKKKKQKNGEKILPARKCVQWTFVPRGVKH